MTDLPLYDPAATCLKCGGTGVGTTYHKQDGWKSCGCDYYGRSEHFARKCQRRGYEWAEAVKEKSE